MKKTLKEFFNFKTPEGKLIDPNTFATNLPTIGQGIVSNTIGEDLVKATNLTKDQIAKSLNNIVVAYMKEKKYDYFSKQLQTNNFDNFLNNMITDIQKFITTLPTSKSGDEFDSYGQKMGWDASTTEKMSEYWNKLYNNEELDDKQAREFIQTLFKRKSQVDLLPDEQKKLLNIIRKLHRNPTGQADIEELKQLTGETKKK